MHLQAVCRQADLYGRYVSRRAPVEVAVRMADCRQQPPDLRALSEQGTRAAREAQPIFLVVGYLLEKDNSGGEVPRDL